MSALLSIFSSSSIMSKKGGVRFKSIRRNKSTRKVRGMPSAYNRSVKLRSLKHSYASYKRRENRKSLRRSTARAAHQAAVQREMNRMARRARGENSNDEEENAPRAASAAASVSENRSVRAAIRSLSAFGNLGEQQPRASTRKQRRGKHNMHN